MWLGALGVRLGDTFVITSHFNYKLSLINLVLMNCNVIFQLRKAVVDHVSDSFLETNVPLLVLIEAAKAGDEKGVEEYAQVFMEHANKLVEVICLSNDMNL